MKITKKVEVLGLTKNVIFFIFWNLLKSNFKFFISN
jgi:hypothetical protein